MPDTHAHPAFANVFVPGKLTIGLMAPLEAHPGKPAPTMHNHVEMARLAEQAGIAALWLRDVPFFDPGFGDTGQIYDPLVYAGWLAQATETLVLGTGGIVASLRDPLFVAKQVLTLDVLTRQRFLLGLASGDRPTEFAAFGVAPEAKTIRVQEAFEVIRTVASHDYPTLATSQFGTLSGNLDMLPKPVGADLPIVAIGRAGQDLPWLAANVDAWIWHGPQSQQADIILPRWRDAAGDRPVPPYGYSIWIDLDVDPDAPITIGRSMSGGWKRMLDHFQRQQAQGFAHAAINITQSRRGAEAVLEELGTHIIPALRA